MGLHAEAFGNHWSSANKGADILYKLAIAEDYQDASGKYFDNDYSKVTLRERGTFTKAHPDADDETKIKQLVAKTAQILSDYR